MKNVYICTAIFFKCILRKKYAKISCEDIYCLIFLQLFFREYSDFSGVVHFLFLISNSENMIPETLPKACKRFSITV